MDIIPIQASSVPCERVFSSGKETMTPRRRRIKSGFMEKLQMLKFSIRKEKELDFTDGLRWAEELMELEQSQADMAPSDPFAYQRSLQVVDDDGDKDWQDEEEEDIGGGQGDVPDGEDREFLDIYVHEGEQDDDDDIEGLYADA
jgi:hypothetical protein